MRKLLLSMIMIAANQVFGEDYNKIFIAGGPQWNWISYKSEMDIWRSRNSVGGFMEIGYDRSILKIFNIGAGLEASISGGAKSLEYTYYTQSTINPSLLDSSFVTGYFDEKIYSVGLSAHGLVFIPNTPIYFAAAILPEYILAVRLESKGVDEPMTEIKNESVTSSYNKLNLSGGFSAGIAIDKFRVFCTYNIGYIDIAKHRYWDSSKKTNSLGFGIGYQVFGW